MYWTARGGNFSAGPEPGVDGRQTAACPTVASLPGCEAMALVGSLILKFHRGREFLWLEVPAPWGVQPAINFAQSPAELWNTPGRALSEHWFCSGGEGPNLLKFDKGGVPAGFGLFCQFLGFLSDQLGNRLVWTPPPGRALPALFFQPDLPLSWGPQQKSLVGGGVR